MFLWIFVRAVGTGSSTDISMPALASFLRIATGLFGLFGIVGFAAFYGQLDSDSRDISAITLLFGEVGFALAMLGYRRLSIKS